MIQFAQNEYGLVTKARFKIEIEGLPIYVGEHVFPDHEQKSLSEWTAEEKQHLEQTLREQAAMAGSQ